MLRPSDGGRSPTCVCSQQHTAHSNYSTVDEVSEEAEDEEDDVDGESTCSPNCDCRHSSSSACHSPITETDASTTLERQQEDGGGGGRSRHQPFYLHPRKEMDLVRYPGTKQGFHLNGSGDHLENRKNQGFSGSQHHHHQRHHRHHHRHQHNGHHCEQEPFYLHDPKSIVYTRVKELFGSSGGGMRGQYHQVGCDKRCDGSASTCSRMGSGSARSGSGSRQCSSSEMTNSHSESGSE